MDDGNSFASVKSACALAKSGRKTIWIMSAADKTCIMIFVSWRDPFPSRGSRDTYPAGWRVQRLNVPKRYRGGSGAGPASLLKSAMVSASRGNSRIAF